MFINSLKRAMAMPSIRLLDSFAFVHTVDAEDGSPVQALGALEWIMPVELVSASVYACLHCDSLCDFLLLCTLCAVRTIWRKEMKVIEEKNGEKQ